MHFTESMLPGVWIIDVEPRGDARGFLARTYCAEEFAAHGLCTHWVQMSSRHWSCGNPAFARLS